MSTGVGVINDLAVSQLIQAIKNGEMRAIQYWLNRRHADFNASYALSKIKLELYKHQDKEVGLTPEEEAHIAYVLKGLDSAMKMAAGRNASIENSNEENEDSISDI